ncbi:MAG: hypothetical protein AAF198_02995 [Pseudomonadota bacterium]
MQELLAQRYPQLFQDAPWLMITMAFILHGIVFVWQTVGVLRAAEREVLGSGVMAPLWGAQAALLMAGFWVLSYGLEAWQMAFPTPLDVPDLETLYSERASRYDIQISQDGDVVSIQGSFELGITDALQSVLAGNPDVILLELQSEGGNIYEARGLAALVKAHNLSTSVQVECSSSCTTTFIAGRERALGTDGRLGFHQYRIDADYTVLGTDPKAEQERDRNAFKAAGVSQWFLNRMFDDHASSMWYPSQVELLEAGVLTKAALDQE